MTQSWDPPGAPEWSSPRCKWHQASRKSLHDFKYISCQMFALLLCTHVHKNLELEFFRDGMRTAEQREICRKVLGRTLEAIKLDREVMSRNVWRYNLSPDGQLDFSHESNYFGRGRSSTKTFFCHSPLNRGRLLFWDKTSHIVCQSHTQYREFCIVCSQNFSIFQ